MPLFLWVLFLKVLKGLKLELLLLLLSLTLKFDLSNSDYVAGRWFFSYVTVCFPGICYAVLRHNIQSWFYLLTLKKLNNMCTLYTPSQARKLSKTTPFQQQQFFSFPFACLYYLLFLYHLSFFDFLSSQLSLNYYSSNILSQLLIFILEYSHNLNFIVIDFT